MLLSLLIPNFIGYVGRAGERTNVNSRRPEVWNVDSKGEFTLSEREREREREREGGRERGLSCVR